MTPRMVIGLTRPVLGVLTCAGMVALAASSGTPHLDASIHGFVDSDGDLLPDDLEWSMLSDPFSSDSDGDGVDDYTAHIEYVYPSPLEWTAAGTAGTSRLPNPLNNPGPTPAVDHGLRFSVSVRPDPDGTPAVWMHFAFRFVGGSIPSVQGLDVWLNHGQMVWSLGSLLGVSGASMAMDSRAGSTDLVFSSRLGREAEVLPLCPATIGATVILDGRMITSGVMLSAHAGKLTAFTPTGTNTGVVIALDPAVAQDPFWSTDRVCYLTLSVLASTGNGSLCEVARAQCRRSDTMRCPPSCPTSVGQVVFVPDGITTLTGN